MTNIFLLMTNMANEVFLVGGNKNIQLKKALARILYNKGYDQSDISKILSLSQPQVSNYCKSMDRLDFDLFDNNNELLFSCDVKEKRQNYTLNNWPKNDIPQENLFIIDDLSVRKIGLKQFWTLRWRKTFNTAGTWTLAGGVSKLSWPDWMRDFKDY